MLNVIWTDPDWAEGLLIAAAICATALAVIEATARNTVGALLPVAVALITVGAARLLGRIASAFHCFAQPGRLAA